MEAQAASAGPFPVPGLTPPAKRTGVKRRIGDVIVQLGFAERELVESVVEDGRRNGMPLGQALIEAGIVNSGQLAQALAERNGLEYVDLNVFDVDKGAASLPDEEKARRYRTIPIAFMAEHTLLVATAHPANLLALDDITTATGYGASRAGRTCACASGSTVWCSTRPPCRAISWPASSRGSRSWPSSTSRKSGCRRTGASACPWTATTWTCALRRCQWCAARRAGCGSSSPGRSVWLLTASGWGWA